MTDSPFATVSMAEIMLGQDMVEEARRIVAALLEEHGGDPRTVAMLARLEERMRRPAQQQIPASTRGVDSIALTAGDGALHVAWELTEEGLAIARRRVRYSGRAILRLFTASLGPRGVRTQTSDLELSINAATTDLTGLSRPAVHVAAVGFLGHNGAFVPLARSAPVASAP